MIRWIGIGIVAAIAVAIIIACLAKIKERKKKNPIGKIFKTTDGYFFSNTHNKNPRRIVVVEYRKRDNAVAVSKIHSLEGKEGKIEKYYVKGLYLQPNSKLKSIRETSIVKKDPIFAVTKKNPNTKKYEFVQPIYLNNLTTTNDKLSASDMRKINRQKGGNTIKSKIRYAKKSWNWHDGFRHYNKRKERISRKRK